MPTIATSPLDGSDDLNVWHLLCLRDVDALMADEFCAKVIWENGLKVFGNGAAHHTFQKTSLCMFGDPANIVPVGPNGHFDLDKALKVETYDVELRDFGFQWAIENTCGDPMVFEAQYKLLYAFVGYDYTKKIWIIRYSHRLWLAGQLYEMVRNGGIQPQEAWDSFEAWGAANPSL